MHYVRPLKADFLKSEPGAKQMMKTTLKLIFLFVLLIPSIAQAYTETIYVCQGGDNSAPNTPTCSTALDDSALNNGRWWGIYI
jgi:hypothetical protein